MVLIETGVIQKHNSDNTANIKTYLTLDNPVHK
jgi:hypothetical protein